MKHTTRGGVDRGGKKRTTSFMIMTYDISISLA